MLYDLAAGRGGRTRRAYGGAIGLGDRRAGAGRI